MVGIRFASAIAVMMGMLRFFYGWPLKYLALPTVTLLLGLSVAFSRVPALSDVLGLAWAAGAQHRAKRWQRRHLLAVDRHQLAGPIG